MATQETRTIKRALRTRHAISEADVRALLREIMARDYGSLRAMARVWKLSAPYLSDVLAGKRHPGPKVLRLLGVRRVVSVTYMTPEALP